MARSHLIPRARLLGGLRDRLLQSPVVAILGARQVGKTTLAREILGAWGQPSEFFDLEKPADRRALAQAPERTLRASRGLVVLDEVQRMPELFEALRPLADDPERRAVYLLLGSASPDLVRGVSESLAGRIQFVRMGGLSVSEVGSARADRLWLRGGFPALSWPDRPPSGPTGSSPSPRPSSSATSPGSRRAHRPPGCAAAGG